MDVWKSAELILKGRFQRNFHPSRPVHIRFPTEQRIRLSPMRKNNSISEISPRHPRDSHGRINLTEAEQRKYLRAETRAEIKV